MSSGSSEEDEGTVVEDGRDQSQIGKVGTVCRRRVGEDDISRLECRGMQAVLVFDSHGHGAEVDGDEAIVRRSSDRTYGAFATRSPVGLKSAQE